MRYYHRTAAAAAILREGFRDAESTYGTGQMQRGVFLSDFALDVNEGAGRSAQWAAAQGSLPLLAIEIDQDLITEYEWTDDLTAYREWCVPAHLLNSHGTVRLLSEDEIEQAELEWLDRRLGVLREHGIIDEDEYQRERLLRPGSPTQPGGRS